MTDSLPHSMLLKSPHNIGIQGRPLNWFMDYTSGRSQRVILGVQTSEPVMVTFGVPQGSILGQLIFNIIMISITNIPLSSNYKLVLYANDILQLIMILILILHDL